jgi:hypothetical protein
MASGNMLCFANMYTVVIPPFALSRAGSRCFQGHATPVELQNDCKRSLNLDEKTLFGTVRRYLQVEMRPKSPGHSGMTYT